MATIQAVAPAAVIDWSRCALLESNADTQGGAWVFRGTRVTVSAILRNLSELTVPELSQEFPTVRQDQITGLLDFLIPNPTLISALQTSK